MKIVVAKAERRLREEGKTTVFFHNGIAMPTEKIENFKRRKLVRETEPASPSTRERPRILTVIKESTLTILHDRYTRGR
jgi:hypothetical protein